MNPTQLAIKYAKSKQPAGQMPRHDCHKVHPDMKHEEWLASLKKEAGFRPGSTTTSVKTSPTASFHVKPGLTIPKTKTTTAELLAALIGSAGYGAAAGFTPGALIGSSVGGAKAPKGYFPQSLLRGGIKGGLTGAGVLGGGIPGLALGSHVGHNLGGRTGAILGGLSGALAGGWGGGSLGSLLGSKAVGPEHKDMKSQRELEEAAVEAVREESKGREEEKAKEKKSMDNLSPFALGFFTNCAKAGYTEEQVKTAVDSIGDQYGKAAGDELRLGIQEMEKRGVNPAAAAKKLPWLADLLDMTGKGFRAGRHGADKVLSPAAWQALTKTQRGAARTGRVFGQGTSLLRAPTRQINRAESIGRTASPRLSKMFGETPGEVARTLLHTGGGAFMGGETSENMGLGRLPGWLAGGFTGGRMGRFGGALSGRGWAGAGRGWKDLANWPLRKWQNLGPATEEIAGSRPGWQMSVPKAKNTWGRAMFGRGGPASSKSVWESLKGGGMGGFAGWDANLAANMLYGSGGPGSRHGDSDLLGWKGMTGSVLAGMLLRNPSMMRRMKGLVNSGQGAGWLGRRWQNLRGATGAAGRWADKWGRPLLTGQKGYWNPLRRGGDKTFLGMKGHGMSMPDRVARRAQQVGLAALTPVAGDAIRKLPDAGVGDYLLDKAEGIPGVGQLLMQPGDFRVNYAPLEKAFEGTGWDMETSGYAALASNQKGAAFDPKFLEWAKKPENAARVEILDREIAAAMPAQPGPDGKWRTKDDTPAGGNVTYGQSLRQNLVNALVDKDEMMVAAKQELYREAPELMNNPQLVQQVQAAGMAGLDREFAQYGGIDGVHKILQQGQGGMGFMNEIQKVLSSFWGMIGMGDMMANVHPLAQLALLIGGGSMIGGMLGGNKGLTTLGGLGLGLGALGAMGGLGGGQQPEPRAEPQPASTPPPVREGSGAGDAVSQAQSMQGRPDVSSMYANSGERQVGSLEDPRSGGDTDLLRSQQERQARIAQRAQQQARAV